MRMLFDAFWRAAAYCMHPRVIGLSFVPLVLMVVLSFAGGYFFWDSAVAAIRAWLDALPLVQGLLGWIEGLGFGALRAVIAPLLLLVLATPAVVVLCLLLVALFMTPAMVDLVARRRFPDLAQRKGGSLIVGLFWSFGSTLLAVIALLLSMPLWLVPPLVLVLPPLIWGWLTYRVFAFDALATHASGDERREIMKTHRGPLLVMGVLSGYLGAAPSLLWASGALFIALAPLLVPLAIWIYTLVFAFASLWFAHYALAVLAQMRGTAPVEVLDAGPVPGPPPAAATPAAPLPLPPADPQP